MKKQYNNKLELLNIINKTIIKPIKFNSLDKAKRYLKSEGYKFRQAFNHKEERTMLYQNRFGWVKISSSKDYLNDNTMEQGTVWKILKI